MLIPSSEIVLNRGIAYGTDTGIANAYVATLPSGIESYLEGIKVTILINNTSTLSNPTLNVGGFGALTIIRNDTGGALNAGDIQANSQHTFILDVSALNWRLINPYYTTQIADSAVTTTKIADGAVTAAKASALVGAWGTKTNSVEFQADTDGFISGWGKPAGFVGATALVSILADATSPTTTVRGYSASRIEAESSADLTTFACALISKGEYCKITVGGGAGTTIMWRPIGS